MRTITLIIVHCSATPEGQSFGFEACRTDHVRHRRFRDIGYHFYITRDGEIHRGRPMEQGERTAATITGTASECATKAGWTVWAVRRIHVPWHRKAACWRWCAN